MREREREQLYAQGGSYGVEEAIISADMDKEEDGEVGILAASESPRLRFTYFLLPAIAMLARRSSRAPLLRDLRL